MSILKIMISYFTCFKFSAMSSKAGSFSYQFNNIQRTSSPNLKFLLYWAHLFSTSQPLCYWANFKTTGIFFRIFLAFSKCLNQPGLNFMRMSNFIFTTNMFKESMVIEEIFAKSTKKNVFQPFLHLSKSQ